MKDFKEKLYESLLFSFGKVLAKYNAFAQKSILKDVGKEIIEYLNKHGFEFKETNTMNDAMKLLDLFLKTDFQNLKLNLPKKGIFLSGKIYMDTKLTKN